MSSLHGTIRRYQLLIEKVGRGSHPSAKELLDYMHEQGFEIAKRTLQRDIDKLRFEFGVELTYNRTKNGYFLPEHANTNTEQFLRLAYLSQLMGLVAQSGVRKDKLEYLQFESRGDLKGLEFMPTLLRAIERRQVVRLTHTAYYREESNVYDVWPYFLKEYKERWYLVGWVVQRDEFRSFGVDRINELEELDRFFDRDEHPDPTEFFEQIIGMTYSLSEREEVELSFDPFQGNYIKTLKLHHSQTVLEDSDEELRIRLSLRPNFEFKQILLGYGDKVKVLKPVWLAEEIAENLRQNLKQYE